MIKIHKCKVWRHALLNAIMGLQISLITGTTSLTPEMIELRNMNQTLTLLTTEVAHTKLSYRSIAILETSILRTFSKRLANYDTA